MSYEEKDHGFKCITANTFERFDINIMNLLHLKYAVEIAKTGSLNKAAENLCMGQPNLSRSIRELEAALGINIFTRSAKGMRITLEGEEFLQYARKILSQVDAVENLYRSGNRKKQKFSISVPRACYISEAFARFSKNIDNEALAELFYKETNALHAIKNITDDNYKLGIIRYAKNRDQHYIEVLNEKNFIHELVVEFQNLITISSENPLAEKDDISFDDLKKYTEVVDVTPYTNTALVDGIKRDNTERQIYIFEQFSQFEVLSENSCTFMMASPIPEKILKRYDLVQRPCIDNTNIYKDVLIYRSNYHLTDLDKLFITELCNVKRQYFRK